MFPPQTQNDENVSLLSKNECINQETTLSSLPVEKSSSLAMGAVGEWVGNILIYTSKIKQNILS